MSAHNCLITQLPYYLITKQLDQKYELQTSNQKY